MFRRLLIANRGEIAVRIIRACRELGIESVAVYSDADSSAPHRALADRAVRIGPAPATHSYLSTEAVLRAAKETGAEAIHPGYGFLAENHAFAAACIAGGLIFVGPPPDVIASLGSKIAARQVDNPMLRFGDPNPAVDPTQQTEDLGSDAVKSTELGLKNIARVAGYLVSATCKEGEDYELLSNMYTQLLRQRDRELGHVANVVGGVVQNNLWYGQRDRVFDRTASERQRAAVAFLIEHGLKVPNYLVSSDILDRIDADGVADRILSSQRGILSSLLDDTRIRRMSEYANRSATNDAYTPAFLIADLHAGIFTEFNGAASANDSNGSMIQVDLYRRNLQRAFVEQLGTFASSTSTSSDMPALSRAELKRVQEEAKKVQIADGITRAHLDDLLARIQRIFEPKDKTEAPSSPTTTFPRRRPEAE